MWVLYVNALILIVFGLASYDKYAKRWSAKSGKNIVSGHITWSELIDTRRALISYSYHVNGVLYNGEIRIPAMQKEEMINKYPKGKEINVYYATKDPGFSRVDRPPSHLDIIGSTVFWYLLFPLGAINLFFGPIFVIFLSGK